MISIDNAQGFNPNYANLYDPTNAVYINQGVVIKSSARQSYATNAVSLAIFEELCNGAKVKYQYNTNRSDIRGGSTLGPISIGKVSILTVDIGLAQLAMHSAMETCGKYDLDELIKVLKYYHKSNIKKISDKEYFLSA